ncbi:MAG: saccharopine dehydrogenase NADP-binding domain-containing protein [Sulfurifustis sp.]
MRVVVLGGYGNFGARICRALAQDGVEVIAAGRDPERGHRKANFDGRVGKARVDLSDSQLASRLRALSPNAIVHCAGPFQGQDYRVAFASLDAGAHYIDLADGRSFVARFAENLNAAAKTADRIAISGASTLPALSSAVVDAVAHRFRSIEAIQIYIAPGQHAPRGAATAQAVLSYVGKRFMWWKEGCWQPAHGWQELRRVHIDGVGSRWSAACDVPDLELFPARYPSVKTVQFRAALEVGVQHIVLAGAAQLRRWGVAVPLERWAHRLDRVATWLDGFGSDRGGMLVSITGLAADGGARGCIEWHLAAGSNHGPEIPSMPAILLIHKLARDEIKTRGAMPCLGLLSLEDFTTQFPKWNIRAEFKEYR